MSKKKFEGQRDNEKVQNVNNAIAVTTRGSLHARQYLLARRRVRMPTRACVALGSLFNGAEATKAWPLINTTMS